jgi:hypothetical protein
VSVAAGVGPRLRVWHGQDWLGEWQLAPGRALRLGRSEECDVVLADPLVSRRHLEVQPVASGGWDAVDLGSTAGTRCNGEPISRHRLRSGDRLTLGACVVVPVDVDPPPFAAGAPNAAAPLPPWRGPGHHLDAVELQGRGAPPPVPPPGAPAGAYPGSGPSPLAAPTHRPGNRLLSACACLGTVVLLAAVLAVAGWFLWPRLRASGLLRGWPGVASDDLTGFSPDAARVGPAGGVVEIGGARLEIPAGALGRDQRLELLPAAETPALTYQAAGPLFSLRTEQATFGLPLMLTLPIDRRRLPPDVRPEQLHVVLARHGLGERLPDSRVDLAAGTVTVRLDHAVPLVAAQAGGGTAGPPVVQVAIGPTLGVVLATSHAVISAPADLANARDIAADVGRILHVVHGRYRDIEIDPGRLHVDLVPMNALVGAYVSGPYRMSVNPELWVRQDDAIHVRNVAHEYFHLIQNRFMLRNLRRLGDQLPNDFADRARADWIWEATATWMEVHLIPSAGGKHLERLNRDFCYRALNAFDQVSVVPNETMERFPHQYSAFVFFSYLDTLYAGRHVVLTFWQDYLSGAWVEDTVANDAQRGRESFDTFAVLDRYLQATPDRLGRRRNLREVYAEFLLHYNWRKDFAPLAGGGRAGELGVAGELPALPPAAVKAWTLPAGDDAAERRREDTAAGGPFSIVAAYEVTNGARGGGDRTDLEVRLGIPGGAKPEESLLVVFPRRGGTREPLVGNSRNPVRVADWQGQDGAVVWAVDLSRSGFFDLTTTAEVKPQPVQATPTPAPAPTLGPEVCKLVERKAARWEEMETGSWQVNAKPGEIELTNAEGGTTMKVALTPPPAALRRGQEVPFEVTCTAPPGYWEQGAIGRHWQTTTVAGNLTLTGFSGSPPSGCGADNSHPTQTHRGVARFDGPDPAVPPGPRELIHLRVKVTSGNNWYYQDIGWWYDCR